MSVSVGRGETMKHLLNTIYNMVDTSSLDKVDITVEVLDATPRMIYDMYKSGTLVIDPDIQRGYVWDRITASMFIDSLLRGYPVPPIMTVRVLDENGRERLLVVDGAQRIMTIVKFYDGELRLTGIPKLGDTSLEGKTYGKLPDKIKEKLDHTPRLKIWKINIAGDRSARLFTILEIFRRLNLGSRKLTTLQVIFCTLQVPHIQLARALANTPLFNAIFRPSEIEKRLFNHYCWALSMLMTFTLGIPVPKSVIVVGLLPKYMTVSEEEVRKAYERAELVLRYMAQAGITRDFFTPKKYALTSSTRINMMLLNIVVSAFNNIVDRVPIDVVAHRREDIQKVLLTVLNSSRTFTMHGIKVDMYSIYMTVVRHGVKIKLVQTVIDELTRELYKTLGIGEEQAQAREVKTQGEVIVVEQS